tara:strand:- start:51249 stop:51608 length:360 start_codon:yes stop_codon:yes gene_type:complete
MELVKKTLRETFENLLGHEDDFETKFIQNVAKQENDFKLHNLKAAIVMAESRPVYDWDNLLKHHVVAVMMGNQITYHYKGKPIVRFIAPEERFQSNWTKSDNGDLVFKLEFKGLRCEFL